jgi:hypothetical protein
MFIRFGELLVVKIIVMILASVYLFGAICGTNNICAATKKIRYTNKKIAILLCVSVYEPPKTMLTQNKYKKDGCIHAL